MGISMPLLVGVLLVPAVESTGPLVSGLWSLVSGLWSLVSGLCPRVGLAILARSDLPARSTDRRNRGKCRDAAPGLEYGCFAPILSSALLGKCCNATPDP